MASLLSVLVMSKILFVLQFHYIKGESAAFFVEGSKAAEALKKVSHKITVKDGSKVDFHHSLLTRSSVNLNLQFDAHPCHITKLI